LPRPDAGTPLSLHINKTHTVPLACHSGTVENYCHALPHRNPTVSYAKRARVHTAHHLNKQQAWPLLEAEYKVPTECWRDQHSQGMNAFALNVQNARDVVHLGPSHCNTPPPTKLQTVTGRRSDRCVAWLHQTGFPSTLWHRCETALRLPSHTNTVLDPMELSRP
jgi:hypothetical protein